MNLAALIAVANLLTACTYATASIASSTISTTALRRNNDNNNNSGNNNNDDGNDNVNNDAISFHHRRNNRHLLESNTECVLYLKNIRYEDGHGEDSWSCEFPPELAKRFGDVGMMDIKGVSKEELDARGAVSGESIVRVDASAYVQQSIKDANRNIVLQIPQASGYEVEMMDSKIDTRHAHNRRARLRRERKLDSSLAGSLGTFKVLVVRIVDGAGTGPDANAEVLQENIFNDKVCLKSQYEACSHDQVLITQATEFSTTLENNVSINGIVDVHVNALAVEGNYKMLEYEAMAAANNIYGRFSSLAETFDLVMFCQPPGTGDWLAYAYVNDWRSFYNNKWCQRVSAQMHEVGHNMNLAHSGLPNDSVYADKSGMMGFSYNSDNGPIQCFNAAKSYQLGWYSNQTLSINPLDYIADPQTFVLNGVADYQRNGVNGDALVSLRLEHEGLNGGIDYYIGYNRKKGCNSETVEAHNLVTLMEKENPYANSKVTVSPGRDGYGLSRRIAALNARQSTTLENYAGTTSDVTLTVNYIKGKKASITISTSASEPTQAPTICVGNSLKIELGTDSFGSETRWSIKDKETSEIVIQSTEGYFSNTVYKLPSPTSSYCVIPGMCYIFTITDKVGDGMCCAYGLGYYRGYLGETAVFEGGIFNHNDSTEFCVPSDNGTGLFPTTSPTMVRQTTPQIPSMEPSVSPSLLPSLSPSKVQTEPPSPDSVTQCGDDPHFRFRNIEKWDCEWAKKRKRRRLRTMCKKTSNGSKVTHQCKETCGKVGVGPCANRKKKPT
jgi:hypothetical protein